MAVHLEPISWMLRAGPEMAKHGDPYQASAVVISVAPGVVRVIGLSDKLYPGFFRDAKELARQMGITKILWERKREEGFKPVVMEVTDK